ncbi:chemotaxis protein CheD [Oxalobacteraceae bacterium]|nr:chemotaxis protein CheD [Oxalobacteraceae bacterium]
MSSVLVALHCQEVGMGQLKVGCRTEQLHAVLGSCVGIGLLWKKTGRGGLAHCLLPEAPGPSLELSARYVSQAVPGLLRLMGAHREDYPDIEAIVAGGASMFKGRSQLLQVGQQNVLAAQKYLAQCGLHVCYCALGGRHGRQMLIDCAEQSFSVSDLVQPFQGIAHEFV